MTSYIRKSAEVEVFQVKGRDKYEALTVFLDASSLSVSRDTPLAVFAGNERSRSAYPADTVYVAETPSGAVEFQEGDFLVKEHGEYYCYSPKEFRASFEAVKDDE